MAKYLFWVLLVIVISLHCVFGRDCSDVRSILNCNECIRCGAQWCNKPGLNTPRCTSERHATWCPDDREIQRVMESKSLPGNNNIYPVFSEATALVGIPKNIPVVYVSSVEKKVAVAIINTTTQSDDVMLTNKTTCSGDKCTVTIEATPGVEFCPSHGRSTEHINVRLKVDTIQEDINLKYHVPCACECSQKIDLRSEKCNFHGDFSCGICFCEKEWNGEFCDQNVCKKTRGDNVPCTHPNRDDVTCAGNGFCGPCDTCECYNDMPGSQYFDKENYCADLCLTVNTDCDSCLRTLGKRCDKCQNLYFTPYNQSSLESRDYQNRNVWVRCNETLYDGCYVEYAAMKEAHDTIVMVTKFCDATAEAVVVPVKITIPVILGILGFIAAAAAVTGYMVWKNRTPPLPLSDPQYENIGAEDCTGENPLYKPPTSSFKNPTYGKW